MNTDKKVVAVIVAHPDDETLWAGGLLIDRPEWEVFMVCLCRKNDPDRAEKFSRVLEFYGAKGTMADLEDGPEQHPLPGKQVQKEILQLLPHKWFDLVITHSPDGEYTRHRRHEEVSRAVIKLWNSGRIRSEELWTFSYEDGNRTYFPKAITKGTFNYQLSKQTWQKKYQVMTELYGFEAESWEAMATPKQEAFRQYTRNGNILEQSGFLINESR